MHKIVAVMLFVFVSLCFAQDVGTVSPDTLLPSRQVIIPAQFTGASYERLYTGDSVSKFNDKYQLKLWVKRAGSSIAFDSIFVIVQPKTRGLDTLNNRRGYTWRVSVELLPR